MDPLGIGLIGCGRAAAGLHGPALRDHVPGAALVAASDLDPDRLRTVADALGIPRRHPTAEALIADPAVDVVAVLTPAASHVRLGVAALEAGKHLFVEKPLALSLAAADRLIACAAEAPGQATVGFNLRRHRLVRQAKDWIGSGRVGRPFLVQSAFTSGIGERSVLPDWRRRRSDGGGVLFEIATHHLDLWRFLFDTELVDVQARSIGLDGGEESDDGAAVQARLANGMIATGVFSQRSADANWLQVHGPGGRIDVSCYAFDGLALHPASVVAGGVGVYVARAVRSVRALPAAVAARRRGGDFRATYAAEWANFLDCVRTGRMPETTLDDGRCALQAVQAAVASLQAGRPVGLDEVIDGD